MKREITYSVEIGEWTLRISPMDSGEDDDLLLELFWDDKANPTHEGYTSVKKLKNAIKDMEGST